MPHVLRLPFALGLVVLLGSFGASAVPDAHAAQSAAYVVTSDYMTGGLSAIDLDTHGASRDVATVHSDAVCRWYDGKLYVVNRFGVAGDNIQVIDPAAGFATVLQFSTGNGSNPQDIAFASAHKAYVSRLGVPSLMVVDPSTGASAGAPISLAEFADGDGNPECFRLMRIGRWLFVSLQRLQGFVATDTSLVAVVDTEADTLLDVDPTTPGRQAIVLAGTNPATRFAYDAEGGRVLVGCSGNFGVADGGIEAFDPFTFEPLGLLVSESALGGDIVDLAWKDAAKSYAIVSDASYNTSLVSWSAASGAKLGTLFTPGGYSLPACVINDRGELYVADNDFLAPGVFVFSTTTDLQIAGPLDTGLPPFDICFDAPSNDVLHVPRVAAPVSFSGPWPNPADGIARFQLSLAHAAPVRIEAFDVSGRRVRVLADGTWGAGAHEVAWDLTDDAGRRVGSGMFWVAARVEGNRIIQRMAVLE